MATLTRFLLGFFCVVMPVFAACNPNLKILKTPNMIKMTPRLQAMFERTKTVCFGRFIVDVPASATVGWGGADIPLRITVYPGGVEEVNALGQKFIDELKNGKAIYLKHIPLLISVGDVVDPEGKIVTGYDGFEAMAELKISGYFKWKNDAFIVDARPLMEHKDQVIAEITSAARRLRQHENEEMPTEPGNCIEYAFLPDEPNQKYEGELVRIGFRLKEFPDTHVSIFVRPSNPNYSESDSLEHLLDRLEKSQMVEDPNHPGLKTKYFRRAGREIQNWGNGFEVLSRTPETSEAHSVHSFIVQFRGVPSDPLKPFLDVRMDTGVADDAAGAIRPSLTDEEAIAVWDKIVSTIRVRPTKSAAAKANEADPDHRRPLGELAATGRICPESGWWQSEEGENPKAVQRRHIKAGEVMPHVTSFGEPSVWQKLRGDKSNYRTATMWKLVDYDDGPAQVNANKADDNGNAAPQPKNKG